MKPTVNTTAPIQSVASQAGHDLVISAELHAQLDSPPGITFDHLGEFQLKGREQVSDLYAVSTVS